MVRLGFPVGALGNVPEEDQAVSDAFYGNVIEIFFATEPDIQGFAVPVGPPDILYFEMGRNSLGDVLCRDAERLAAGGMEGNHPFPGRPSGDTDAIHARKGGQFRAETVFGEMLQFNRWQIPLDGEGNRGPEFFSRRG